MKVCKKYIIAQFFVALILLSSCDRPVCENKNPVFEDHKIGTVDYNNELVKEIKRVGKENMTHWVVGYLEKDSSEFLIVHFQSKEKDLCIKGYLKVNDWSKMKGLKEDKAVGWRGSELIGLTYDFEQTEGKTVLIFKDLQSIFD